MLDSLNDDCQLAIFKYLNLDDQIDVYLATRGVSKRLNSNVIHTWKHQLCFKLNWMSYKKFEETPKLLDIFLSSINVTVQQLKLETVTVEFLKRWENYTFPSMKTLEYTLNWRDLDYLPKTAIKIMAKLFPGLCSVTPHGVFSCELLPKCTQLRKLDLSRWSPDFYGHNDLDLWCYLAKCQLLEELTLCCRNSDDYKTDLLTVLPKLHTISLMDAPNSILADMLDGLRDKDIHTMIFKDCIWKYKMSTLRKLTKLRHLALLEFKGNFTSEKLRELIVDLNQLEQLDIFDVHMWSNEADLWQTVAGCPSLKNLKIFAMNLDKEFFEFSRVIMEETLRNRSQPLTLQCDN
ncbi:hypothetical protein KR044_009334, partial [Drosophila immigrans]